MRSLVLILILSSFFVASAIAGESDHVPTFELREIIRVFGDVKAARPDGRLWSSDQIRFARYPSPTPGDPACGFVVRDGRCDFASGVPHDEGDIFAREDASLDPPRAVFHLAAANVTLADVVEVGTKPFAGGQALALTLTPEAGARNHDMTSRALARQQRGDGAGAIAVLIDGIVVSDPIVIMPSSDHIVVHGRITPEQVQRLANAVRARKPAGAVDP